MLEIIDFQMLASGSRASLEFVKVGVLILLSAELQQCILFGNLEVILKTAFSILLANVDTCAKRLRHPQGLPLGPPVPKVERPKLCRPNVWFKVWSKN